MSSNPVLSSSEPVAGTVRPGVSALKPRWLLSGLLGLLLSVAAQPGASAETPAPVSPFTPAIEDFVKAFKPGGQDFTGQATTPPAAEALRQMVVPEGYRVDLIASEPGVRQPLDLHFDARGRLWVVQYLQYPFPAGSRVIAYDQYLRADYDRISPPPPHHVRGADRITILEDRDGDGTFESNRTFLDGLNLATSALPDTDGVWVLQSPYLLFYPDRNGDDVPDSDPEVHLTGFGLEDTHSLASNLHWGPDGWIYGATGSTTTLEIQGIRLLGQGIWRYHPGLKTFEVFAEGGGNTFSLEFDRVGRAFSGTNSGATRGLHYVQGGTYVKNWPKHGAAMNPFLFGFFEHMAHEGYSQRFPQTFLLYEGGSLPDLEGQVVVGMAMTNRVQASRLLPDTSSFRTVDTTALVTSENRTFRPVDLECGPDGAIYIADWTDLRLSHLNPADTWDKSTGRIYRIAPTASALPRPRDLRREATPTLLSLLSHPNRELREQARRLLATRPEPLRDTLFARIEANGEDALEALWVLHLRGEIEEAGLRSQLHHPNPHLRRWAVRLLGDRNQVNGVTLAELTALARRESDVEVRSQLASSARRLPAGQTVSIVRALLTHDEDAADLHLPLLLWWALEAKADSGREELLAFIRDPASWRSPIVRDTLAERIGRRYTADQSPRRTFTLQQGVYSDWIIDRAPDHFQRNLEFCGRLLAAAPNRAAALRLVQGMAAGFHGRAADQPPRALLAAVESLWPDPDRPSALVALAARLGRAEAVGEAVRRLQTSDVSPADEPLLLGWVASEAPGAAFPWLAAKVKGERDEARRGAYLSALAGYENREAALVVMELYGDLSPRLRATAQRLLCEQSAWAVAMLERIQLRQFDPGAFSSANLAALRSHLDPRIATLRSSVLSTSSADPAQRAVELAYEAGKTAFSLSCAPCHQDTGEGRPGLAPALVGSPWLQRNEDALVRILLHGKENPGRGFVMPPWRHLEDPQLAAVLTYVKREFGNQSTPVTPATVARVRAATADRTRPWTDPELEATLPRP
jgi:mono/diheme cytochrome c family protein/glucose/arabinose dehydrogenase